MCVCVCAVEMRTSIRYPESKREGNEKNRLLNTYSKTSPPGSSKNLHLQVPASSITTCCNDGITQRGCLKSFVSHLQYIVHQQAGGKVPIRCYHYSQPLDQYFAFDSPSPGGDCSIVLLMDNTRVCSMLLFLAFIGFQKTCSTCKSFFLFTFNCH